MYLELNGLRVIFRLFDAQTVGFVYKPKTTDGERRREIDFH